MYYNIEIKAEPEYYSKKLLFFWCVTKNSELGSSNNGHGWSCSVEQAAADAYRYYQKNIQNKKRAAEAIINDSVGSNTDSDK